MRVLHVVESLARGGLERVVADLCVGQREKGLQVSVLCLYAKGPLADELSADGVDVHGLTKRNGLDLEHLSAIRDYVRRKQPNVVHTHNASAAYLARLAVPSSPGVVWVNTRHGMGASEPRSRKELLFRLSARRYTHIVAVCHAAARRYESLGAAVRTRLRVVPNGIRVHRFDLADDHMRQQLRTSLGLNRKDHVIGCVARLNPVKNQGLIIDCLKPLLSEHPSLKLVFVGDGPMKQALLDRTSKLGLQSHVFFAGDQGDVAGWLHAFDTFVLTSITEGYSLALLEASAAGLPIVCTDVGGNTEIVKHDQTGIIVPLNDRSRLTAALSEVVSNEDLRRKFSENARQWAKSNADVSSMVSAYVRLYRGT
jgi:glycosyltransferase involved in cell wall biosynthesis